VWHKLTSSDLIQTLRYCDVISFRYNIIGQGNPNRLERIYNQIAMGVHSGTLENTHAIKQALKPVYPSDDEFRESFAKRAINASGSAKKLVRYVLCAVEKHLHNMDLDFETTNATIEHILPERPSPEWQQGFPRDMHERYVRRLGNYLLLEAKLNRELAGNEPLEVKRVAYARSQYPSTRQFDWEEWTAQAIEERQAKMARAATAIWRLP
jgi:hypothetical protein